MSARLHAWLMKHDLLPPEELEAAVARWNIYGGSLDTALLERGAMSEETLWAALADATGLPRADSNLCDPDALDWPPAIDGDLACSLNAVPVHRDQKTVDLLCGEPIAEGNIQSALAGRGLRARLHVVPEVRLLAMRQRAYGTPLPARYVPLLANTVGVWRARTAFRPAVSTSSRPATNEGEETPPPLSGPPPLGEAMPDSRETAPMPTDRAATAVDHEESSPGPATPLGRVLELSGGIARQAGGDAENEPILAAESPEMGGAQPSEIISDGTGEPLVLGLFATDRQAASPEQDEPSATGAPTARESERAVPVANRGHDAATEALCRRGRDHNDRGRLVALRALRRRFAHPAVQSLRDELRATVRAGLAITPESTGDRGRQEDRTADTTTVEAVVDAIVALKELRDFGAARAFVALLGEGAGGAATGTSPEAVATAAHEALVAFAGEDLGWNRSAWLRWVDEREARPRGS